MPTPLSLTSWNDSWSGLQATVLGLGDEGFAIADTLVELGCQVSLVAQGSDSDRESILDVLGVEVIQASEAPERLESRAPDFVVVSSAWDQAASLPIPAGTVVWSEVEFTARVADKIEGGPNFVLVAGAQSELIASTATALLSASGQKAFLAGEGIGPALDAVRIPDGIDTVVWSISPSVVEQMSSDDEPYRRPVLTVSIGDDEPLPHELLVALYRNTERACVYRRGGQATEQGVEDADVIEGCRAIGIGLDTPPRSDLGRVEDIVCDRAFLDDRADRALELCTTEELERAGFDTPETSEAALAAFAIARAFDVPPELIGQLLTGSRSLGE